MLDLKEKLKNKRMKKGSLSRNNLNERYIVNEKYE